MEKRPLLIVYSYHNMNTLKIAREIGKVIGAEVKFPWEVDPEIIEEYDLVGFGSGIYGSDLHRKIHELLDDVKDASGKDTFIFSTNGAPVIAVDDKTLKKQIISNHSRIKKKLDSKGFRIIDEFSCPGHNTNLFLKLFGGINKGRPNEQDLKNAREFSRRVIEKHMDH